MITNTREPRAAVPGSRLGRQSGSAPFPSPPRPPTSSARVPSPRWSPDSHCPHCWLHLSLCGQDDMNEWAGHTFRRGVKTRSRSAVCSRTLPEVPPRARDAPRFPGPVPVPSPRTCLRLPGQRARIMLPSAVAAQAGAYWDVVASSALLGLPSPGFGSLGKSFLIENLLRAGAGPTHAPPPPRPSPGPECPQLRSLPASPVPLKLCPAGPYGARWAFQMPSRAPADQDSAFQSSTPGELCSRGTSAPGNLRSGKPQLGEPQSRGASALGNLSPGEPHSWGTLALGSLNSGELQPWGASIQGSLSSGEPQLWGASVQGSLSQGEP